jgi:hypothetical protein
MIKVGRKLKAGSALLKRLFRFIAGSQRLLVI